LNILVNTSIALIVHYQRTYALLLDVTCRHYPSCSEYAVLALQRYGFVAGWRKGLRRVADCHPGGPRSFIDMP
jgi:putative membrane protein insertion efficiency factor